MEPHRKRKPSEPLEGKEPELFVLLHVIDDACCDSELGRFAPIKPDHPMLQGDWKKYRFWKNCDSEWKAAENKNTKWVLVEKPPFDYDHFTQVSVSLNVVCNCRIVLAASIEYHHMS